MNDRIKKTVAYGCGLICLLLLLSALLPADLCARAGGGGGGGGGGGTGGILGIILYPLFLIYIGILHFKIYRKNKEAAALIEKFAASDSGWRMESLKQRIEECFYRVQEAWTKRNQDLARNYMSRRLYEKHREQTNRMIRDGEKNILKNIELLGAKIVEAIDYTDNSKDSFWAYIKGSMIDYTVTDPEGKVIEGDPEVNGKFVELWKFTREDGRWVLDEIDSDVSLEDLDALRSRKE